MGRRYSLLAVAVCSASLVACFESGAAPAGNGGAGRSPATGGNGRAGASAGMGAAAGAGAMGGEASPDWPSVAACGAECGCDEGRFIGVWVCHEDADPFCSCDDAVTRGETCTPGATVSCTCPDGSVGSQACADDGLGFGACSCR